MQDQRPGVPGGTYFFTLALQDRSQRLLTEHIGHLRAAFRETRARHPFEILAIVILPDHLHCLWRLPADDGDYPLRWNLIRSAFSRQLPAAGSIQLSRHLKREPGIWQRRYRNHLIRDPHDLQRHLDYIHDNPVRHGLVHSARDWPHSSIHRHSAQPVIDPEPTGAPTSKGP